MRKLFAMFLLFSLLASYAQAATIINPSMIAWDAPTTNADGTPLTDLAGYRIYCGATSGAYTIAIDVGNVLAYQIKNIVTAQGTYFCVGTAYDLGGLESTFSNEVTFRIDTLHPAAPKNLRLIQ